MTPREPGANDHRASSASLGGGTAILVGLGVWAGLKAKSKIRNQRPSRLVGSYCRGGSAGEARLRKERVDSRDALHAFKERLDTANEKMESIAESMNRNHRRSPGRDPRKLRQPDRD